MVGTEEEEEEAAKETGHSQEPGLGPAVDFVTRVVAPASLLTAVLYYFGYTREQTLFGYFGVDLGSLRFSTTDYLVRSVGTIFLPIAIVLVCGVVAVTAHYLLVLSMSQAEGNWPRVACIGIGAVAVVLLAVGVIGLLQGSDVNLPTLALPLSLGAGAFLLEYTVHTAAVYTPLPRQLQDILRSTRNLRRIMIGALLLVSAFWATATVAEQRGNAVAQAIEGSLLIQPQAVVYSRQRLEITGPGVTVTRLVGTDAAFFYRYNGLRPLIHSGGHWFLLPAGWTHNNDATVIILPDSEEGIRVDLIPGFAVLPRTSSSASHIAGNSDGGQAIQVIEPESENRPK
jgi:hypothetical protein